MTQQPISYKNAYNIFKTDEGQMEQLLKKYSKQNLYYRSEEFSQQAETFVTRMASDKKIPSNIKAHFPLQQIFMSICKVFMLNEYEILALACTLDHCGWKVDEVVQAEEKDHLDDFPITGVEIEPDCKRFIMYLLVIAFSVKQYLNEKTDIEGIQAFCEKTCKDFHIIFNRWASSAPSLQRFTYSAPELNRKYKALSLRSSNEMHSHLKDYNQLVENIMALTGSYNAKSRARDLQSNHVFTPPTGPESSSESRVLYSEGPLMINPEPEKVLSRQGTFESNDGGFWGQFGGSGSGNNSNFMATFSQLSTNFASNKKSHQPMDLNGCDNIVKKLKYEQSNLDEIKENNESFEVEDTQNNGNNFNGSVNGEEFFNMASGFSKKPSFRFSQLSDDFPMSTPQFNFSLTFSQENRGGNE